MVVSRTFHVGRDHGPIADGCRFSPVVAVRLGEH